MIDVRDDGDVSKRHSVSELENAVELTARVPQQSLTRYGHIEAGGINRRAALSVDRELQIGFGSRPHKPPYRLNANCSRILAALSTRMTFNYYRCDWVHHLEDEPVTIFYQVDAEGRVPRRIDVFADGRRACVSIKDFFGREAELPGFESLVEGSFYDGIDGLLDCGPVVDKDGSVDLLTSDRDAFEAVWQAYRLK